MAFDQPLVPDGVDPIDGDLDSVRAEVLRLRDALLAADGRREVLEDRILELEAHERALAQANDHLTAELARSPLTRLGRAVARRFGGRA